MKNFLRTGFSILLSLGLWFFSYGQTYEYYVKDKQIRLTPQPSMVFLSYKKNAREQLKNELLSLKKEINFELISYEPVDGILMKLSSDSWSDPVIQRKIERLKNIQSCYPAMQYEGETLLIQQKILALAKPGFEARAMEVVKRTGTVLSEISLGAGTNLIEFEAPAKTDVFSKCRQLFETGLFVIAEPSVVFNARNIAFEPNDPWRTQQWYLGQNSDADIDALEAFGITQGSSSVTVAVIDGNGYDVSHPDMVGKYVTPYDAVNDDNDPSPENADANHGTPCAGLVGAATNNSIGVAGVGFNTRVLPIVIGFNAAGLNFSTNSTIIARAAAKVVATANCIATSNSWSTSSSSFAFVIETSYLSMKNNTRGGLGAVNFCAYGNSNTLNPTAFPANFSSSFTVAATNASDVRASFSNYGTQAKIAAPGEGGIYTIDRSGSPGYSTGDYANFSGTSAATPIVAGVAGLIAAVLPSASAETYERILAQSADKTGGYAYATTSGYPYGTWNQNLGYGRVNAYKAVLLASACNPISSSGCSSGFINNFTLGTLNNSGSGCSVNGYGLFAGPSHTTSLRLGLSNTFSITGSASLFYGIWIDLNGDGDFADASEFLYANATANGSASSSFTLPDNNALLGEVRLRVRCKTGSAFTSTQSCTAVTVGETEDYYVRLVPRYCLPVYAVPCTNFNTYIDEVIFGGMNNSASGCSPTTNYTLFTPNCGVPCLLNPKVVIGNTYPISVRDPSIYGQNMGVWIDFNNDSDFDDAGEFVFSGYANPGSSATGNVTIPNNAAFVGNRRMRVRSSNDAVLTAGASCTAFTFGETEDYTISILSAVNLGTLSAGNQTLCNPADPANVVFSSLPAGSGFSYQWFFQNGIVAAPTGSSTTGWTSISGATSNAYDPPSGLTTSRSYACFVTPATGMAGWASGVRQVTVRPVLNFGTLASGNQSFVGSGDPNAIALATQPSGGSGTFNFQWFSAAGLVAQPTGSTIPTGWTAISGATTNTFDPPIVSASISYALRVDPTGSPDCGSWQWASGVRQITINAFTPGVLTSGNQTLCNPANPGNITFSSPATTGSTFQWYFQDGIIAPPAASAPLTGWTSISGATLSNYDPPAGLTANRTFACRVTNGVNSQWASGVRQITVVPVVSFGTLAAGNQTFSGSGDPNLISFSPAPSGGAGTFAYRWYSRPGIHAAPTGTVVPAEWTLIAGATSATYDPPVQTASISFAVMVDPTGTPDCGAFTWASGVRQITVNVASFSPGVLASGNQTICNLGDPATIIFSTAPTAGSSFQWYFQNGIIAAPANTAGLTGWTLISGSSSSSYDPPSGLAASRTFACRVTNGANSQWATGVRQVTVLPAFNPGTITAGDQSFCTSGDPANITLSSNPVGSGAYSWRWYFRENSEGDCPTGGTVPIGWNTNNTSPNITGTTLDGTGVSFDPQSAGALNAGRTFAVLITPVANGSIPACGTPQWANSCRRTAVVSCTGFSPGVLAEGNQSLCSPGDPANIAFSTTPTAGSGFQWYYQNGLVAAPAPSAPLTGWTLISGATSSSYNPPAGLTGNRTFACRVTNGANSQWASGVRQITILPLPIPSEVSEPLYRCGPGPITLFGAPGENCLWYSAVEGGTFLGSGIEFSVNVSAHTTFGKAVVSAAGCTSAVRAQYQVLVYNLGDFGGFTSQNISMVSPADPALISFENFPPSTPDPLSVGYQWYFQNGIVAQPTGTSTLGWTLIAGATGFSYDPPSGLTTSRTYACFINRSVCGDQGWASGVRQITVTSSGFNPGVLASGNQTICQAGDPGIINFSTAATSGSGFQWYFQNGIVTAPANTAGLTGWTSVSGATSSSYDPPAGLTANRTFACRVTNGSNSQWATGVRQVTVLPAFSPGSLIANQSGCVGYNPAPITMATNPQGSGAYNWRWYYAESSTISCLPGIPPPSPTWITNSTDTRFFGTSTTGTGINFDPSSAGSAGRTWVLLITPAANGAIPACGTAQLAVTCHRTTLLACRENLANSESGLEESNAFLGAAIPNPWNTQTEVLLKLPSGRQSGVLKIRTVEGKLVYEQEVHADQVQKIEIQRGKLSAGTYFYSLESNGEIIGTQKMILVP